MSNREKRFTEGPWVYVHDEDYNHPDLDNTVLKGMGYIDSGTLAVCQMCDHEKEELIANAHLIAAAPEMLEALENLENDNCDMPKSAWELVQKAIAKAYGEKP